VEVRLADDGEVLVRARFVMGGYLQGPGADHGDDGRRRLGWPTGDIGELDADGFLKIIDRKKELIITSGGKNVSPALVRVRAPAPSVIGQACAIGDRRNYVTALLVLDPETTRRGRGRRGLTFDSLADLAAHPEVLAEVERGVEAAKLAPGQARASPPVPRCCPPSDRPVG